MFWPALSTHTYSVMVPMQPCCHVTPEHRKHKEGVNNVRQQKKRSESPRLKLKPKSQGNTATTGGNNSDDVERAYVGDRYLGRDERY
jgi:hypothetical protein